MFDCCECCVLSGRGLCNELITRPEESYRLWCVVVCDLETSRMRRPWPALGRSATKKQKQTKKKAEVLKRSVLHLRSSSSGKRHIFQMKRFYLLKIAFIACCYTSIRTVFFPDGNFVDVSYIHRKPLLKENYFLLLYVKFDVSFYGWYPRSHVTIDAAPWRKFLAMIIGIYHRHVKSSVQYQSSWKFSLHPWPSCTALCP
jgi:hypothetical protein